MALQPSTKNLQAQTVDPRDKSPDINSKSHPSAAKTYAIYQQCNAGRSDVVLICQSLPQRHDNAD